MGVSVSFKKNLGKFNLDVSFESENEIMALLGASGSGKSMTLKCIAGIETPDEGSIILNGRVLFDSSKNINLTPQQRRVGYLFQNYALFPNMTVSQNIAAGVQRKGEIKRKDVVWDMICRLRLGGLENKRPRQLSGGQQQRVALARILINEPELILLDEPLSALDSYLKWQLELEFADTLKVFENEMIYVSHSFDEVYRICDSVCILNDGRSKDKSTIKKLFEAPTNLSACLLSGCKNFSHIRYIDETHVEALEWGVIFTIPSPVPRNTMFLGVRSHNIVPVLTPGINTFKCKVERVIEDVLSTVVILNTMIGSKDWSRLRMELDKSEWISLGNPSELFIQVEPQNIMLLQD